MVFLNWVFESFRQNIKHFQAIVHSFVASHDPVANITLWVIMENSIFASNKLRISCCVTSISLYTLKFVQVVLEAFIGKNIPIIVLAASKWSIGPYNVSICNANTNLISKSSPIFFFWIPSIRPAFFIRVNLTDPHVNAVNWDPTKWVFLRVLYFYLSILKTNLKEIERRGKYKHFERDR